MAETGEEVVPDLEAPGAGALGVRERRVMACLRGLLATRPEIVAEDAAGRTEHVAEARQRSAPWILAISPAVAPPILAWLRKTAEVLERPRLGVTPSTAAAVALASELLERLGPPA